MDITVTMHLSAHEDDAYRQRFYDNMRLVRRFNSIDGIRRWSTNNMNLFCNSFEKLMLTCTLVLLTSIILILLILMMKVASESSTQKKGKKKCALFLMIRRFILSFITTTCFVMIVHTDDQYYSLRPIFSDTIDSVTYINSYFLSLISSILY